MGTGLLNAGAVALVRTRAAPRGAVWDALKQRQCAEGAVPYGCASSGDEH